MIRSPLAFRARRTAVAVGGWVAPLALGVAIGLSTSMPLATVIIIGVVVGLLFLGLPRNEPVVVLAFAALCMPRLRVPGLPLPLNEVLMLGSVVIAALHPRGALARAPRWLTIGLWTMFGMIVLSTALNELFLFAANKRLAHLVIFTVVAIELVRGRLSVRAALTGVASGLAISAASGILSLVTGVGTTGYEGRLTGMFGDPNLGGLLLSVLGPLAIMHVDAPRWKRTLAVLLVIALALTYSRTSLLAMALVAAWLFVGRRLRPVAGVSLLIALIAAVGFLPSTLQSIGPFSDRTGSDQLRERIVESELASIAESPIIGHGASTARVQVNESATTMFFHNSYLALAQEGGYVSLAIYVVVLLCAFVSLIGLPQHARSPWIEASIIALAVCALNLGEVLLDLTAAVAIGVAVRHVVEARAAVSPTRAFARPVAV